MGFVNFHYYDKSNYTEQYDLYEKTWTTCKGKKIYIEDLTNNHLINIIRYFKRHNKIIPDDLIQETKNRKLTPFI